MATKTTKTTTTTTAAPKLTAAEILERFEEYLAEEIRQARRSLKRVVDAKRDEITQAFDLLNQDGAVKADAKAAYLFGQLYWGMGDGSEAAGKLKVLTEVKAIYASIREEQTEPRAILAALATRVTEMALDDYRRTENSTNAFSNVITNAIGVGRGEAYRDVARRVQIFAKMLDSATA
jgi:hypothetical protein